MNSSRDSSLHALVAANPRARPDFETSIARYDTIRAQITATPAPPPRQPPGRSRRSRIIGVSAAAAAALSLAGVIVGLTASATSPPSAFAAASEALAATAAVPSGTMTMTATGPRGTRVTMQSTRWNGRNIAFSALTGILGPNRQLLLIGGSAYVQKSDGRWRHYLSETKVGDKLGPAVQLAHDNVAGNTAAQILGLAGGITKTRQPDGSTLYTGRIPSSTADPGIAPTEDALLRLITRLRTDSVSPGDPSGPGDSVPRTDLQLKMTVANDGLVTQMSLTLLPLATSAYTGPTTWTVTYRQLGSTPPITPPAASTLATPAG